MKSWSYNWFTKTAEKTELAVDKQQALSGPLNAHTSHVGASWLHRIALKDAEEAKALPIKVTPEIDAFAEKCVNILFGDDIGYTDPRIVGDAFYEENLMFGGRYVPVKVMVKKPEPSKGLAGAETPTWWEMRNQDPEWSLSACYINVYETIPPRNSKRELKKAIIHELIHCVDEKLNDPNLFDADWHRKHRQDMRSPGYVDSPKHYTAPWEQDAFMSSEAHDQVSMWKRNGVSLERALQELRNHIADNPREQEWKKVPDLWRRYMQTMARAVQGIYQT